MNKQHNSTPFYVGIILLFLLYPSLPAARNISLSPIPHLDKLPVNSIHRLFQDSEGYLWYGTDGGLCRDDGYSIRVFRSDFNTPGVVASNYIKSIAEDKYKNIWFGTVKGVYILNRANYTIAPLTAPEVAGQDVIAIHAAADGSMWLSVPGKLLRFSADGSLTELYPLNMGGKNCLVNGFMEEDDRLVAFVGGAGLYVVDTENKRLQPLFDGEQQKPYNCIIKDKERNCYWLGTWGGGIVRYDPYADKEAMFVQQPLPVNSSGDTDPVVMFMVKDDVYGYLWVTSWTDLFVYSTGEDGNLEQLDTSTFLPRENKMLHEIIKDKDGNLWVAAFDRESFVISFRDDVISEYSITELEKQINGKPAVVSLCHQGDEVFWLNQERVGLYLYAARTNQLKCFNQFPMVKYLPLWNVLCLRKSKLKQTVWVSSTYPEVYQMSHHELEMKLDGIIDLKTVHPAPGFPEYYSKTRPAICG